MHSVFRNQTNYQPNQLKPLCKKLAKKHPGTGIFRQSCDILDLLRSELTRFPQSHHVTLDETIAVAKRDHDTGSRLQSAPQTLRHPVLKCSIQFFVGDIYNDIRI